MQASAALDFVAQAKPALRISARSMWSDQVWHLDGHRPGGNRSDFSLDWGFALADDSRFSDPQWTGWREAAKLFLWSLKLDPPPGRRNVHESTIVSVFKALRALIRWMAAQGCRRFADLDRDGCDRFLTAMAQRPGSKPGKMLKATTLQTYANVLTRLYLQGAKFPEVAIADPFPGIAPPFVRRDRGWLPYTPDAVAVPLLSATLRLIEQPADDVIALQTQAQTAYDDALARGVSQTKAGFIVTDAIAPFAFSTLPGEENPWHEAPVTSTKQVRYLADRIYDACFIVIAYLVGARVSEILGLQVGCIERHPASDDGETFAYLAGQIYKTARGVDGEAHRWVAPAPVERAVVVMERLTARLRAQTGRSELFLVMASTGTGRSCRPHQPAHCLHNHTAAEWSVRTVHRLAGPRGRALASEHPSGPKDLRALCRQTRPHRPACASGALRSCDPGHDRSRLCRNRLRARRSDRPANSGRNLRRPGRGADGDGARRQGWTHDRRSLAVPRAHTRRRCPGLCPVPDGRDRPPPWGLRLGLLRLSRRNGCLLWR